VQDLIERHRMICALGQTSVHQTGSGTT
jgi:hypothetical protein